MPCGTPTGDAHRPVLLTEAVDALRPELAERLVDATYGRGGHSQALLARLPIGAELLLLDRDPEAMADAARRFAEDSRVTRVQSNFDRLDRVLEPLGWLGHVDGVLVDLGVSSPQLDDARRGFGFGRDGALDMRMDPGSGESAADWLARVDRQELTDVLKRYGEERYAKRIAAAIVDAREQAAITRTGELAEIIKRAHPRWERHHHPATRSFQAIRIAINGELDALKTFLAKARQALRVGGRLVVISFHSLEDRIVKRCFRKPPPDPALPRHLPQPDAGIHPWRPIGKAIRAGAAELSANPRARSAVLRVAERIA